MKIAIINGPNLNMLGQREPAIYGTKGFDAYLDEFKVNYPSVDFFYFQSNIEGALVDAIQKYGVEADGMILNPAAYTHTSVAIGDAIAAVKIPVIEVHISNVHAREEFRKISHVSAKVIGTISGLGLYGYKLAVEFLVK